MRQLTILLSLLTIAACGPGEDDPSIMVEVDPDGGIDGAVALPDAAPLVSAENLGQPCDMANPCPNSEGCVIVDFDGDGNPETGGFCTIPCMGQNDMQSCSNMYTGAGQPVCALGANDGSFSCAVLCQVASPTCPANTECIAAPMGMGVGLCAPTP